MVEKQKFSLFEITRFFIGKRIQIIKVVGVFAILGVVIAYTTPEEWSSRVELLPELQTESVGGNGSLKRLAGLAGVNFGGESTGTLSPALYPQIAKSFVFKAELLDQRFYFSNVDDTLSLRNYFLDYSKSSLVGKAIGAPKSLLGWIMVQIKGKKEPGSSSSTDSELFFYSEEEKGMFDQIDKLLNVSIDDNTGVIKVSAMLQDRVAAAMLVNYTQDYLEEYVTRYNTEKQMRTLQFLEGQLEKARDDYSTKQEELAQYLDSNLNIFTEKARTRQAQLQRELDLLFNLYSTLSSQVQEAEIAVEENKAVFTVLKPAAVPAVRSKPKRLSILILSMLLGGILSASYLFYKNYF